MSEHDEGGVFFPELPTKDSYSASHGGVAAQEIHAHTVGGTHEHQDRHDQNDRHDQHFGDELIFQPLGDQHVDHNDLRGNQNSGQQIFGDHHIDQSSHSKIHTHQEINNRYGDQHFEFGDVGLAALGVVVIALAAAALTVGLMSEDPTTKRMTLLLPFVGVVVLCLVGLFYYKSNMPAGQSVEDVTGDGFWERILKFAIACSIRYSLGKIRTTVYVSTATFVGFALLILSTPFLLTSSYEAGSTASAGIDGMSCQATLQGRGENSLDTNGNPILTNYAVYQMVAAGNPAESILKSVRKEPRNFDLAPRVLACTALLGVPPTVLSAMIDSPRSGTPEPPKERPRSPPPKVNAAKPGPALMIPEGTALTLKIGRLITPKTVQVGQSLDLRVAEDVVVRGKAVIEKDSLVRAEVKESRKRFIGGKGAKISISIQTVKTVGGQSISLFVPYVWQAGGREGDAKTLANVTGDLGVLVVGRKLEIPAGSTLTIPFPKDVVLR